MVKTGGLWLGAELEKFFSAHSRMVWEYYCDSAKKVSSKSPNELVGELDVVLEKYLIMHLPELVNVPVIGEESFMEVRGGKWPPYMKNFWLVDPIDGTHNFLMQNPNFGSIVALVENGEVVFGAIYIYAEKSLKVPGHFYFAAKGEGAWKRTAQKYDIRLKVSETEKLDRATILLEGPSQKVFESEFAGKVIKKSLRFYKGLSSSFALTRIVNASHSSLPADLLIMCGNKPWDSLAGAIMVEEAGGVVTGIDGKPYSLKNYSDLIYTNKHLHKKILALR